MEILIYPTKIEMAKAAAEKTASIINETIERKGYATFIAATGVSQFEFLEALVNEQEVDWFKTTMFHLDEYIGLPINHPASFRRYLEERFIRHANPRTTYLIQGNAPDIAAEIQRMNETILRYEIDIAFVGIGENGHLAFNDPPADFEVEDPFITVDLDEACRRQQLGEGWFKSLEEVPNQAISMSIKQIIRSKNIICVVPDKRKQQGVYKTLVGEINPMKPASILRNHENTTLFLDVDAAGLVNGLD
jgi:glucosamine-6-phosphate deaminase